MVNSTQSGPSFNVSFILLEFRDFLLGNLEGNGNKMIIFMLGLNDQGIDSLLQQISNNMNVIISFPFPQRKSPNFQSTKLMLKDGPI